MHFQNMSELAAFAIAEATRIRDDHELACMRYRAISNKALRASLLETQQMFKRVDADLLASTITRAANVLQA